MKLRQPICLNQFTMQIAVLWLLSGIVFGADLQHFDETDQTKVADLSRSGQCKAAWDYIWPKVMLRSNTATLQLFGEMTWGNIHPPLSTVDEGIDTAGQEHTRFVGDILFFARPKNENELEELKSVKQELLGKIWDREVFALYEQSKCLESIENESCFNPDKWQGMVTKLEVWNKRFHLNKNKGLDARCRSN